MRLSLNMARKIWLSFIVLVGGFVVATVSGQIQGVNTEAKLRATSEALFPAAQSYQQAEAGFQRAVKGFSDAVMTQDQSNLERAVRGRP